MSFEDAHPDPSTPPGRIQAARERAGLEIGDVAERLGLTFEHVRDLEMFDDEANMTLSLRELRQLAELLNMTPLYLLEGAESAAPARHRSFVEFAQAVASAAAASGDAAAWSDQVGWEVAPLIEDPEKVGDLNVDGLRDIAAAVGWDWREVL